MPCSAHAKSFTQGCQLPCRGQTSNLADMDTDIINQPLGNQLFPFQGIVEQLAHGNRNRHLAAEVCEPLYLLRRQGILQEKQTVGL